MAGHLVLVDGSGYLFRAFHALPPMSRPSDGTPVNAVFGYTKLLIKILEQFDASHMAVIFDAKGPTFRNELWSDYKANRPPPPEDLVPQFSLVREATKAMCLPCIEKQGYEADDIIATYARLAEEQGLKVTILSTDKDLMQLVKNDHIYLYDSFKGVTIGETQVQEKFGVMPDRVIDVQALAGDASDNVPGVAGIGIKTAAELINAYGDLENLLAHTHEIKQPKRRERLTQDTEKARISYELCKLDQHVPDLEGLDTLVFKDRCHQTFADFLAAQGFKSLLAQLKHTYDIEIKSEESQTSSGDSQDIKLPFAPNIEQPNYTLITRQSQLDDWIKKLSLAPYFSFDTETTSVHIIEAKLVGISFSCKLGEAAYIPINHNTQAENIDLFAETSDQDTSVNQLNEVDVLKALQPLLENPSILKIGHNVKYDIHILRRAYEANNLTPPNIHPTSDTMVMSFDLYAGLHGHSMDYLAENYLTHTNISYDSLTKKGNKRITFDDVDPHDALDYAAEDADITLRLYEYFEPRLAANQVKSIYTNFDNALIPVLENMEARGIKVDIALLQQLSSDFGAQLSILEAEIHQMAGKEFNIASPAQLGEVLFDEMGFEGGKRSKKTKKFSTSSSVLEKLAEEGHPFPVKIMEYRQLAKLRSTYTEALLKQIDSKTQRIHTNYLITGAITGRLASNDPNLQNIPIRTNEGRKIRKAFICNSNYQLISADYSQAELRLMAHVADETALIETFNQGIDVHTMTAHQVFGAPLDGSDTDARRNAKAINFGIIYGVSAFGLARQLGISNTEGKEYIDAWFARFPKVRQYMHDMKEYARTHGYVKTFMGRKIHIIGLNDKGPRQGFAERLAINAPIQGGAADIVKIAMINLHKKLAGSDCHMLLQVHDELVFEAPIDQLDHYKALIKSEMENAVKLNVAMEVDVNHGSNWDDAH